jgi:hypothetical protein
VNDATADGKRYDEAAEACGLNLVADLQNELAGALNSLGGMSIKHAAVKYGGFAAKHANHAAEAYVLLRQTRRFQGSKLLVRLVIESTFRFLALNKHPSLIYRIMLGERQNMLVWLRAWAKRVGDEYKNEQEQEDWDAFKKHCVDQIHGVDLTEAELSVEAIARAAEGHEFYESHYRLYSGFTHGAFAATTGQLDWVTNPGDNTAVAACLLEMLTVLRAWGAKTPTLPMLDARFAKLHRRPEDRNVT